MPLSEFHSEWLLPKVDELTVALAAAMAAAEAAEAATPAAATVAAMTAAMTAATPAAMAGAKATATATMGIGQRLMAMPTACSCHPPRPCRLGGTEQEGACAAWSIGALSGDGFILGWWDVGLG